MPDKIQIVLDADVIIHFSQGGYLHLLPQVIPDCSFVVLSVVRNELRQNTKNELDNHIFYLKNISLIVIRLFRINLHYFKMQCRNCRATVHFKADTPLLVHVLFRAYFSRLQ